MLFNNKLPVLMVLLTLYGQGRAEKIIGGHVAEPHSRPYMVFIRRHLANNDESFCDGFLLNEDFVLTAAHCQAKNYTVYLGVDDTKYLKNDKIQDRTVEKVFPHENYDKNAFVNDIMLLKLGSKAVMNNFVKPISLASRDDETLPKSCIISGWGQTRPDGAISDKLMEMNVTLVENSNCTKLKLYCSDGIARPGKGDSGGPLVCGHSTAYGVVAFMSLNPNGHSMVAYTKTPCYVDWITSTMKKALSKK
ncbi:granzyme B-like [Poeciliopsis prolifica]|uniref:granzyme B-like n=1 Tax=Poeciliopsis prolifica TaxID=188132 RepID=UPI002413BCD9|nr:granzyme B-like [Poeciliopsis prolifica]